MDFRRMTRRRIEHGENREGANRSLDELVNDLISRIQLTGAGGAEMREILNDQFTQQTLNQLLALLGLLERAIKRSKK